MRMLLMGFAVLAAGGCMTTKGARMIKSDPPGALVTVEGFGECETPCRITLDTRREVTVAKAGYKAQRFGITPGGRSVMVVLELAAPTDDVDAIALPELD